MEDEMSVGILTLIETVHGHEHVSSMEKKEDSAEGSNCTDTHDDDGQDAPFLLVAHCPPICWTSVWCNSQLLL
jgi:hypothetical protein